MKQSADTVPWEKRWLKVAERLHFFTWMNSPGVVSKSQGSTGEPPIRAHFLSIRAYPVFFATRLLKASSLSAGRASGSNTAVEASDRTRLSTRFTKSFSTSNQSPQLKT